MQRTRTSHHIIPAAALSLLAFTGISVQAAAWDLATDWSSSSNPNGAWSYRAGSNFMTQSAGWAPGGFPGTQSVWIGPEAGAFPMLAKASVPLADPQTVQVGDVFGHLNGDTSLRLTVAWTSPINGNVSISGNVWSTRAIGRSSHWSLILNNTTLTDGAISGGDVGGTTSTSRSNPMLFSSGSGGPAILHNIPIMVGSVLKLELQPNTVGVSADYVGMSFTIESIPEPASLFSIAFGSGLLLCRRPRRPTLAHKLRAQPLRSL